MTVRELLSLCKNVNYGFTKVTVFDRNGGSAFPRRVIYLNR